VTGHEDNYPYYEQELNFFRRWPASLRGSTESRVTLQLDELPRVKTRMSRDYRAFALLARWSAVKSTTSSEVLNRCLNLLYPHTSPDAPMARRSFGLSHSKPGLRSPRAWWRTLLNSRPWRTRITFRTAYQ